MKAAIRLKAVRNWISETDRRLSAMALGSSRTDGVRHPIPGRAVNSIPDTRAAQEPTGAED
jgi:hypothetical protein